MPRALAARVAHRRVALGPLAYALRLGIAASLAFAATTLVLDTPRPPLLAPWTAVFALYPTVIESFRGALRRLAALALGAAVAVGVVTLTGTTFLAVAVVVTAAGLVGRWPRLGEQGIQVPGGAVLVLVMAQRGPLDYLAQFAVETSTGVLAALAVNALAPPLNLALVRDALDRLRNRVAELLEDVADESRNVARGLFAHEDDDAHDLFSAATGRERLAAALRETAAAVRTARAAGDPASAPEFRRHLAAAHEGLDALGGEVHAEPGLGGERMRSWSREHAVLVSLGRLLTELDRAADGTPTPSYGVPSRGGTDVAGA